MVNGVATDINAVFSLLVSSIRCICMVLIQASISHGSCLKNKKTKVQKVSLVVYYAAHCFTKRKKTLSSIMVGYGVVYVGLVVDNYRLVVVIGLVLL